jgi:hypothetical protein
MIPHLVRLLKTSFVLVLFLSFVHSSQAAGQQQDHLEELEPANAPAQPLNLGPTIQLKGQAKLDPPLSEIEAPELVWQAPEISEIPTYPGSLREADGSEVSIFPSQSRSGEDEIEAEVCTNHIRNWGFESNSDWSFSTNVAYNTQTYYQGARSLFMTTQNKAIAWVGQTVQLPTQMESIFVRWIFATQFDTGESAWVDIYDATTNTRLESIPIASVGGQWYVDYRWLDQNTLVGKLVNIYFIVYTDNDYYYSNLWLDNVELASCATPTPGVTDDSRTFELTIAIERIPTQAQWTAYQNIIYYAADAIYEMTEGKHYLGKVTFYPWAYNNSTHVQWFQGEGRPGATLSGYNWPGRYVKIFDTYPGICGYMLVNVEAQRCAGYTLAHELGHYIYGLADEYYFPAEGTFDEVEYSVMSRHDYAVNGDYTWLNFSVPIQSNGWGWNYNNKQNTYYLASGWETLIRPHNQDPETGYLVYNPDRVFYSELVNVAPRQTQYPYWHWPYHQLPGGSAQARSRVQPGWIGWNASELSLEQLYSAQVVSYEGGSITYPQPALLEASVSDTFLIARAGIQAQVVAPGGQVKSFDLVDNGIPPDEYADDGRFTGFMPYDQDGSYNVTVNFDNESGDAIFTFIGLEDIPDELGDPVGENFSASAATTITVSGFADDDHSDQPQSATTLPSNNLSKLGRIDQAGDVDMFKGTLLADGLQVFRLSEFAQGMQPRIRFWDTSSGALLGDFSFTPDPGYYYIIYITGQAGASFYAGISHSDSGASSGLYHAGFGPPLTGELVNNDIYLPLAVRNP